MTNAAHERHIPVLLDAVVEHLRCRERPGRFLDCTLGGCGHTRAILKANPGNHVVALDRDPEAIARGRALENEFSGRLSCRQLNFSELPEVAEAGPFAGVLFDLGVSSFHFDEGGRGFSFRFDAPVDMRMDPTTGRSGAEFLERASESELVHALRDLAEERSWRRVLKAILEARGTGALSRTGSLADLIRAALGGRTRPGVHPATRVFQGIRMAVNEELPALERALPAAFELMEPGGRLAVISFHSLEDRLVKQFFRRMAGQPEGRWDNTPQQDRVSRGHLIQRRGVVADGEELARNPRARSARLRILEKEADA